MEEAKMKAKELMELKDKLVTGAKEYLNRGAAQVDPAEMGQITDMIKDLAEAEEKCWKACYYKSIVMTMKEEKEREEQEGRMGYDNWRYSSGRFAPTGRGHYSPSSGYTPMDEGGEDDYWMNEGMEMMGYSGSRGGRSGSSGGSRGGSSGGGRSSRSSSGSSGGSSDSGQNGSSGSSGGSRMGFMGSERGAKYDRYNQARMGYHDSKDMQSKEHMDATAKEYVVDMAESIREVWKDADPAMRKEIKNKFASLVAEMG